MLDTRLQKLAESLVNFSCSVKKGENVLVALSGLDAEPLAKLIIKEKSRIVAMSFLRKTKVGS